MTTPTVLAPALLEALRAEGVEACFPAGHAATAADGPPRFNVVLEGTVGVEFAGADGLLLPLDEVGPGGTVGEMTILTGGLTPLRLVARTPVRVLGFPGAWLAPAMERHPALRRHVLASLAHRVNRTRQIAWELQRRVAAGAQVGRIALHPGALVARSPAMKEVRARLDRLRGHAVPLLIRGDRGTGKSFLATRISLEHYPPGSPFLALDCRQLDAAGGAKVLAGTAGAGPCPGPSAELGALHLAAGGILLLRQVESLPAPCQAALLGWLDAAPGGVPPARVICTSRHDLLALAQAGRFDPRLAAVLSHEAIRLPAMDHRKKDIPGLVGEFLAERTDQPVLAKDAAAALYARAYRSYNAAELKGVVNGASVMAAGAPVRAAHVIGEQVHLGLTLDPQRGSGLLSWLVAGPGLRLVRWAVGLAFAAIGVALLATPAGPAGAVANALLWMAWLPLVALSFPFLGRLWCTACPLARPGHWLQGRLGLGLRVPAGLKAARPLLACAGVAAIMAAEHLLEMRHRPFAAGMLLVTLAGLAALASLAWEGEAWCQLACPLGVLGGVFANGAALRVWANPWECTNRCTGATCVHPPGGGQGCPMGLRPNHDGAVGQCTLCTRCVGLCREQAVTVRLQLPAAGLLNAPTLDGRLAPLALMLPASGLLSIAWDGRAAPSAAASLGLAVAGVAVAELLHRLLHRLFRQELALDPSLVTRMCGAVALGGWAVLGCDQLGHFDWPANVRLVLVRGGADAGGALPGVGLGTLLQAGLLAAAAAVGAALLVAAWRRVLRMGRRSSPWRWALPAGLLAAPLCAAGWLAWLAA